MHASTLSNASLVGPHQVQIWTFPYFYRLLCITMIGPTPFQQVLARLQTYEDLADRLRDSKQSLYFCSNLNQALQQRIDNLQAERLLPKHPTDLHIKDEFGVAKPLPNMDPTRLGTRKGSNSMLDFIAPKLAELGIPKQQLQEAASRVREYRDVETSTAELVQHTIGNQTAETQEMIPNQPESAAAVEAWAAVVPRVFETVFAARVSVHLALVSLCSLVWQMLQAMLLSARQNPISTALATGASLYNLDERKLIYLIVELGLDWAISQTGYSRLRSRMHYLFVILWITYLCAELFSVGQSESTIHIRLEEIVG